MMVFSQDTTATGSKVNQAGSLSNNNNNKDASKSEQQQQPSSKVARGRKPSKSSRSPLNKNKPRRRGMGIEKLERLTPWCGGDGNLLPADVASAFSFHSHTYHQLHSTPPSLIPLAASPSVYVGSDLLMTRSSSASSFMAASSSKIISSTLGGGGGGVKELSSIPKVMKCHLCDASCYSKNKCMNMEEMEGMILGGMNNQDKPFLPNSLINCHTLTGLNHGHNNVGLEMKDFNSRVMRQMVFNQDSEMMGINRPQVSSSCSNLNEHEFFPPEKGLKEYEFFPETTSGRSYSRFPEQPNHYYTTEPAADVASYFIPNSDFSQYNGASVTNSNSLDLSLKLSL